ncbi:prokaryotic phospholipase A2-domain-containing protein [Nemania sp. NC0429]|nr:prokaryotic phospholipase A2-domain-containing protein [Nemania sp. NC0429]
MKTITALLTLLPASLGVIASPLVQPEARQSAAVAVTDDLLFDITLPAFTSRRNARNPSYLDWTSDECTSSPDNPLGFPFHPACERHDFGYQNYRLQSRFTESGKLNIDNNFKDDLYYQCSLGSFETVCEGLAEVYYAAVRAFGGGDATPGRFTADALQTYQDAVNRYNQLVEEAGLDGKITP